VRKVEALGYVKVIEGAAVVRVPYRASAMQMRMTAYFGDGLATSNLVPSKIHEFALGGARED
jgi:hypothetical protein